MSTEKLFTGVTLHGMPVRIEMQWPFHPSEGGSDYHVAHATLRLNDGGPLHADIALNLSQSVKEVLNSLDSDLAYWVAVNSARKSLDDRQLQLLKSGKRQPVPLSSRCYSIRFKHFTFASAKPEQIEPFVAQKVFWSSGSEKQAVLVADPCDALYLNGADEQMLDKLRAAAKDLAAKGMIELKGDEARATDALLARRDEFIAVKEKSLEDLHAKHAFERA